MESGLSFGMRLSTRDCSLSEAELIEMVHHGMITHRAVYMRLYAKTLTIETYWSMQHRRNEGFSMLGLASA